MLPRLELAADNLQTVGRNGLHRYNNLDHSMQTGMLAVQGLFGPAQDVWKVNSDDGYLEERSQSRAR